MSRKMTTRRVSHAEFYGIQASSYTDGYQTDGHPGETGSG
jgi:hypothetical protein